MRGDTHVRCGGRAGETDREQSRHRAPARPTITDEITAERTVLVGFERDLATEAPARPTGSAACSPSSTPAWNASSAHAWTTRLSPGCWNATVPQPLCEKPDAAS